MKKVSAFKPVIIIPCYNHVFKLARFIDNILAIGITVIIVDDRSPVAQSSLLQDWVETKKNIIIIFNQKNLGKGGSVIKAMNKALELGFTHAIQIDADGQIDYSYIIDFLQLSRQNPDKLICGSPTFDNQPKARYYGRFITHFWVMLEMGSSKILDSMCGIRAYPIEHTCKLFEKRKIGTFMDFDTEVFVRLYWSGMDYLFKEVKVEYPKNGISNFRPFKDNVRLFRLHSTLFFTKIFHYFAIKKRNFF